jgi:hypothetical protein
MLSLFLLSACPQPSKFRVRLYRVEFSHSPDPILTSTRWAKAFDANLVAATTSL